MAATSPESPLSVHPTAGYEDDGGKPTKEYFYIKAVSLMIRLPMLILTWAILTFFYIDVDEYGGSDIILLALAAVNFVRNLGLLIPFKSIATLIADEDSRPADPPACGMFVGNRKIILFGGESHQNEPSKGERVCVRSLTDLLILLVALPVSLYNGVLRVPSSSRHYIPLCDILYWAVW
jgi:hypothetical protein